MAQPAARAVGKPLPVPTVVVVESAGTVCAFERRKSWPFPYFLAVKRISEPGSDSD